MKRPTDSVSAHQETSTAHLTPTEVTFALADGVLRIEPTGMGFVPTVWLERTRKQLTPPAAPASSEVRVIHENDGKGRAICGAGRDNVARSGITCSACIAQQTVDRLVAETGKPMQDRTGLMRRALAKSHDPHVIAEFGPDSNDAPCGCDLSRGADSVICEKHRAGFVAALWKANTATPAARHMRALSKLVEATMRYMTVNGECPFCDLGKDGDVGDWTAKHDDDCALHGYEMTPDLEALRASIGPRVDKVPVVETIFGDDLCPHGYDGMGGCPECDIPKGSTKPIEGSRLWRCERELAKARNWIANVRRWVTDAPVAGMYLIDKGHVDGEPSGIRTDADAARTDYPRIDPEEVKLLRRIAARVDILERRGRGLDTHDPTQAEVLKALAAWQTYLRNDVCSAKAEAK